MRYSARTILHDGLYAYQTSEYSSWWNMRNRCRPEYKESEYYFKKGITVCDRWSGTDAFLNFYKDMGKKPGKGYSIDRIDPSMGYSPENCRWATRSQQSVNQGIKKSNKSGYRGVSWYKQTSKWRAGVGRKTLGYFTNKVDAALAYDKAAILMYGADAKTNLLENSHAN